MDEPSTPCKGHRRLPLGGATAQVAASAASLALQAVSFGCIARILSPVQLGTFAAAAAYVGIFTVLSSLGLGQATLVELAGRPERARGTVAEALLAAAFLPFAGLAFAAPLAFALLSADARLAALSLLPSFFWSRFALVFSAHLQYEFLFFRQATAEIVGRICTLVALAAASLWATPSTFGSRILTIALAQAFGQVLTLLFLGLPVRRILATTAAAPRSFLGRLEGVSRMVRVALPLGIVSALSLIHVRADQVLLEALGYTRQLADYAVAYRLLEGSVGVAGGIGTVVFAAYGRTLPIHRRDLAQKASLVLASVSILLALPVFVLAPFLVRALAGSAYDGAAHLARLLAVGIVVSTMNMGFSYMAIVERKAAALAWIAGVATVLNITLNLLLIPHFDAQGSAIATVVSEAATLMLVARLADDFAPKIRAPQRAGATLLLFLAASFGGLTVPSLVGWPAATALFAAIVGLFALVWRGPLALLWRTGVVARRDM